MRFRGVLVYVVMFLLFIPFLFANTDYNETGNKDALFQAGSSSFNSELTVTTISLITLNGIPQQSPLVTDLDNDGLNEIIILDGDTFRIFHNRELDENNSFDIETTGRVSNFITFDIDGDGETEIIIAEEQDEVLHILNYTDTIFTNQTSIKLDAINHVDGEMLIKCGKTNECIIAYADDFSSGGSVSLSVSFFNSTAISNEIQIDSDPSGNKLFCFPKIRTIAFQNYDDTGDEEYIFSYAEVRLAQAESTSKVFIPYIDVLDNGSLIVERNLEIGNVLGSTGVGSDVCLSSNMGQFFTSPLVADISIGAGLETIIGFNIDDNEFNMRSYKHTGSSESTARLDTYPLLADADGTIISNVVKANIFPNSASVDFCVTGYVAATDRIDFLCATEQDSIGLFDNVQFKFDKESRFNMTSGYNNWNPLSHRISAVSSDSPNNDEMLNPYGVFDLDFDSCSSITGNCDVTLEFENPKGNGTIISVDAENVGTEDLILLTANNLFYIDDGFVNSPAELSAFSTNPCIDSIWEINTTVQVTVTATDTDGDLVSVRAILYEGDSNEQDSGFSANVSSGTEVPFSFIANKTIGAGTLRLEARDIENPSDVDFEERTFSVAQNGVEFGDCITTESLIEPEIPIISGILNISTAAATNEGLTDFFSESSNTFRVTPTIIILFLMLGWTIAVLTTKGREDSSMITMNKVVFMVIGNIFILLIGIIAGAISFGVLLTLIILAVVILGIWIRKMFTSESAT